MIRIVQSPAACQPAGPINWSAVAERKAGGASWFTLAAEVRRPVGEVMAEVGRVSLAPPRQAAPVPGTATPAPSPVVSVAPAAGFAPPPPGNVLARYRPDRLSAVVGHPAVLAALRRIAAAPFPCALLFAGPTGVGKTSAALALAAELGIDITQKELGGFHEIASGQQTAEAVRELLAALTYRPMFGSGWKIGIVNECDTISRQAEAVWLDALENLPAKTVIVFTTNNGGAIPARLADRCERHDFTGSAAELGEAAASLAARVWSGETGRTDAPDWTTIPGVTDADGNVSLRRLVSAVGAKARAAQ